ncbi:MAG: hypothetical protein JW904_03510 [Spirochaetales bacterium]|nr:hypothetical protein [Spirochaetales bacterium]
MRILFSFVFLSVSVLCFAQFTADPNDALYDHITVWEEKGYVKNLPLVRPYPHNVIKKILSSVIESGSGIDRKTAQAFYDQLFFTAETPRPDRIAPSPFTFTLDNSLWATGESYLYGIRPVVSFQDMVTEWFSYSGMAVMGFDLEGGDPAPYYIRVKDDGKSGGGEFTFGEALIIGNNNGVGLLSFGNPDLYFQAGITRSVFGPFWDNSGIIGAHSPSAGLFSFTWQTEWASFSSVLLILHPKYMEDPAVAGGGPIPIPGGVDGLKPTQKYLAMHSYTFYPFDWCTFTLIQTTVFGKRFEPAYLIPLQHMPYTQVMLGDVDSSFLGIITQFDLPFNMGLDLMLYLDDFNMKKFFGEDGMIFDVNSGQNKVAIQAGLSWTPEMDILQRLTVSYFMVTPYMYTHNGAESSPIPYNSYTHEGFGIGTMLSPNSDRIALNALIQPWSFCDIKLFATFTRHGNASEGIPDLEATNSDGSYWDDGRDEIGEVWFYGSSRFLTQDIIEKILQIGVSADFRLGLGFGTLKLGGGYIFEYGWDRDLVPGDDGARHIVNIHAGIEL